MIVAAIVIAGCARPAPAAVTATGAPATVTTAVGVTPANAVRIPDTSVDHSTLTNDVTDSGDTRSGWVVLTATEADYVSWVEVVGQLTGTVQIARLDDTGTGVKPASLTFTGVRAATKVSIDIAGVGTWQGELDPSQHLLTLRIPRQDGTIGAVGFRQGGIDDYNSAVRSLQGSAGQARASVADADAQTAAARQYQASVDAADSAVRNLRSALAGLPGVLANYDKAAHQGMTAAVAALTKTIDAVPVDCGSVSYQASSVEYARSVVAYANSSFVDQLDQVTVAQDVLSTAKTALYAISEPDGNSAPFTVAEEAVNTVAAAKATAARYDTDADATLAAGDAAAAAACP